MADTRTIEIWIAMDSDGDFAISVNDENDAVDNYQSEVGSSSSLRVVKLTINMEPPAACSAEAEVTIPAAAGQTVTAEVA